MAGGDTIVLAGAGPDGVAVLRLRPSIWTSALECYLAELYVAPERRGEGLGRALMELAIEEARRAGADHGPRHERGRRGRSRIYESLGFTNREGRPDGPIMFVYEREL